MNLKNIVFAKVAVSRLTLALLVTFAFLGAFIIYKRFRYGFLGYEILHALRVNYQRLPASSYILKKPPVEVKAYLDQLNENGIVKISNIIDVQDLAQLQNDFNSMIKYIDEHAKDVCDKGDGFTEDYFDRTENFYCSSNPLKYSTRLAALSCDPKILGIINHYLQGDAHINFVSAARILSGGDKHGLGSYQWHHDAWGKKLHVMFLLTDVGEGDQYMTYVVGSHKVQHSLDKFMHSRLTYEYAKSQMKQVNIFKCMGKAGDIFIFDPNAVHSGNRTNGADRDTFIVSYTRDRTYIWNLDIPKDVLAYNSGGYSNPYREIVALKNQNPPQKLFPKIKCWDQGLTAVNLWI